MFARKQQPTHPRTVIKTDGAIVDAPELAALAIEGWGIKQEIEALQRRQKEISDLLLQSVQPGSTILVDDVVQIPVTLTETISVEDPDQLRQLLDARFEDLVEVKETYKLSDKAKKMAADADDPTGQQMRGCLKYSQRVGLSFRGGKKI